MEWHFVCFGRSDLLVYVLFKFTRKRRLINVVYKLLSSVTLDLDTDVPCH